MAEKRELKNDKNKWQCCICKSDFSAMLKQNSMKNAQNYSESRTWFQGFKQFLTSIIMTFFLPAESMWKSNFSCIKKKWVRRMSNSCYRIFLGFAKGSIGKRVAEILFLQFYPYIFVYLTFETIFFSILSSRKENWGKQSTLTMFLLVIVYKIRARQCRMC